MNKKEILFLVICILSFPVASYVSLKMDTTSWMAVVFVIKNLWVFLLFTPIPIFYFIFGLYKKRKKQKWLLTVLVALGVLYVLMAFGTHRFIHYNQYSYNDLYVNKIEEKMNIDLPNDLKIGNEHKKDYTVTYAYIVNNEEEKMFVESIKKDERWDTNIKQKIILALKNNVVELKYYNIDYIIAYDELTDGFDIDSFNGVCELDIVFYDCEKHGLYIISNYSVEIN